MPTIEVLPNAAVTSHHGVTWAYTTLPPAHSVSGTLPSGISGRGQRARASNYENSAARQRQINTRISDLEKDNYRDVQIPIPKSDAKRASYRSRHTATQNVRRILQSQKTFVNHLADEEALNPATAAQHQSQSARRYSLDSISDADEMEVDPAPEPVAAPKLRSKKGKEKAAPPLPPPKEKPRAPTKEPEVVKKEEVKTEVEVEGLEGGVLGWNAGGPPLGYARAVSRPSKRPERAFCEICGYWGNYRCGKCGARYCDLGCMRTHQEMACGKLFR